LLAGPRDEPPQETPATTTASPETPTTTPQQGASVPVVDNPIKSTDLAMLIVWCFIAGFSEQLIPGLLATTEARAGSPAPSTTDRFQPAPGTTQVAPSPTPQTAGASAQTPATQSQATGKTQPEDASA
jgi:hypothetical protein